MRSCGCSTRPRGENFASGPLGQSYVIRGRGQDFNQVIGTLPLFLTNTNSLLERQGAESRVQSARREQRQVVPGFPGRDADIAGLISSSDRLLRVIARRDQQFADIFRNLPGFIKESKATLLRLDSFEKNTGPFIDQATEIASEISPTLTQSAKSPAMRESCSRNSTRCSKRPIPAFRSSTASSTKANRRWLSLIRFCATSTQCLNSLRMYNGEIAAFFANHA